MACSLRLTVHLTSTSMFSLLCFLPKWPAELSVGRFIKEKNIMHMSTQQPEHALESDMWCVCLTALCIRLVKPQLL